MRGYRLGDRVRLFPGGAALIVPEKVLVVADLHLGCEAALEEEGLSLPRVQTRRITEYVCGLVDDLSPSKLLIAGDLKHNFSRNLTQEWDDVVGFVKNLEGRVSLEVLKGNHDNYLGSILREHSVPFMRESNVAGLRVLHGHEGLLDGRPTIIGHLHPSISLRDASRARFKDQCFIYSEEHKLLVLPALSLVAGGADLLSDVRLDKMSPLMVGVDPRSLSPLTFSGRRVLRFPSIEVMRKRETV